VIVRLPYATIGKMRGYRGAVVSDAFEAGREALRWVTDAAVAARGGATWPETRAPGAPRSDDLYAGAAGVLVALAEAHLSGIADFDDHARAAAGRLGSLTSPAAWADFIAAPGESDALPGRPDLGLYTGLSGCATALRIWASVSGDHEAGQAARALTRSVTEIAAAGQPVSTCPDLLSGEAGILLVLIQTGDASVAKPAVSAIADRLVAGAAWIDGEPDWLRHRDAAVFTPNFSHGAAGIGYALAAASTTLDRQDLLDVALSTGHRLIRLGSRDDGTLAVPYSVPLAVPHSIPRPVQRSIPLTKPGAPVSYGWCHGPTGTLRLFQLLDNLRPGQGWADRADACRRAILASGLPARRYPGFWDNLGQCCGTAGVGEMALDRYQQTGDSRWLSWAEHLADDVLERRIEDAAGIRWSHTEHRLTPPDLEPGLGWMQGAAGIGAWLLRLHRVERDVYAPRIRWPDQCPINLGIARSTPRSAHVTARPSVSRRPTGC